MSTQSLQTYSTDPLTALADRQGLQQVLASCTEPAPLAVLSVQISQFGKVNSGLGGNLADKVIIKTANRLQKTFPDAFLIARTHGDHFCLLIADNEHLNTQIARLRDFTQRPLVLSGHVIVLSVRVGFARQSTLGQALETLLHASEIALQEAKDHHIEVCEFSEDMRKRAELSHQMENDLRVSLVNQHQDLHRALNNKEFVLWYQPIFDLKTREVVSFEALIRWFHPIRGLIPPDKFIPVAEKIGAIDVLGRWIIEKAIHDASLWPPARSGNLVGVSINVSPIQMLHPDLVAMALSDALNKHKLTPERVKLEFTETAAISEKMTESLNLLTDLGCELAMDDFGTGYSSLSQLNHLPLNYLKLDRSFINDLDSPDPITRNKCQRLIEAVLSLSKTYQLLPIVEGVETASQVQQLESMGVPLVQGFYFAKPMPFGDTLALLTLQEGNDGTAV